MGIDEKEVEAMALLLERNFAFDQGGLLRAYQTDSWNYFKDGKYVAGRPESDPEGAEHHGFLVDYDIEFYEFDHRELSVKQKAFKTAQEAARFYIDQLNRLELR